MSYVSDDVIKRNYEIKENEWKWDSHTFGLRKGGGNFLLLTHTVKAHLKEKRKCKEKGEKGREMRRRNERRNEKRKRKKTKREGKTIHRGRKGKRRGKEEKEKEKEMKGEKGKGRIFWHSGGRSLTVRGLKLVHAARSTCGHQKVRVSTNSVR